MNRRTCPWWSAVLCLAAAVLACPRVATAQGSLCPDTGSAFISPQPQSQTIAPGATATLSVGVIPHGGSCADYYWYEGTRGGPSRLVLFGTGKSTYTTPPLTATQNYWVHVVYVPYPTTVYYPMDSVTATITVPAPVRITAQPQSQSIEPGTPATLSVDAIGPGPQTYQWYAGTSGDTSTPIGGATASSYTTPPLSSAADYWVRVSNPYGPADSDTATIAMCAYTLPAGANVGPAAGSASAGVTTLAGCGWHPSTMSSWISIDTSSAVGSAGWAGNRC